MISAKYLIRFDDLCPEMNWEVWDKIEAILIKNSIKPIIAVIPDNKDPALIVSSPNQQFWSKVRNWQKLGWTIGLHGLDHRYVTTESGIVGLNQRSEFAGLTEYEQAQKLDKAIDIFKREGVAPDLWVAPAHSFDKVTVDLLVQRGINIISDGFYFRIIRYMGAVWIPQQIWRFRKFPLGIWTICFHHNSWSDSEINDFERSLVSFRDSIVSAKDLLQGDICSLSPIDSLFNNFWLYFIKAKNMAANIARKVM